MSYLNIDTDNLVRKKRWELIDNKFEQFAKKNGLRYKYIQYDYGRFTNIYLHFVKPTLTDKIFFLRWIEEFFDALGGPTRDEKISVSISLSSITVRDEKYIQLRKPLERVIEEIKRELHEYKERLIQIREQGLYTKNN